MVTNNKNFMFATLYIIAIGFKTLNHSQKLIILNFILYFGRNHLFLKKKLPDIINFNYLKSVSLEYYLLYSQTH